MKYAYLIATSLLMILLPLEAQNITIQVDANTGRKSVSPYIYGRNNNFSTVFGSPTSASEINMYKEAGIRFARENGGNNATKYNWQNKLSSHPDWYNNVYDHDWDYACQTIQSNMPGLQAMWAFQLIGKVAANKNNNFNDWGYNKSQWWNGVAQNLAGGGNINTAGGSKALTEGNSNLYLMDGSADFTTDILTHWFGTNGLELSKAQNQYWSMDNEPEIWNGTHDDVMPTQISASKFMDLYFDVAKKARQKYPDIKLTGPVPANEWQWYKWGNESLTINNTSYCWLEYFLKRVADEEKATGIRLLDVVDLHWYPSEKINTDILQSHRIFFDQTYDYPGANGIKTVNGGWNNTLKKEYIFQRINDWLTLYFGENHGITIGMSEFGSSTEDANINSILYASMLGTFANNGVEFFTPWTWNKGMWETLHLFSRYAKTTSVKTTSSLEATVSGYTTINANSDSMTIILVNRDITTSRNVTINLTGFEVANGTKQTLQLSSLPATETFISHTSNALKSGSVNVSGNTFIISLPPVSTTAVILNTPSSGINPDSKNSTDHSQLNIYPNPATNIVNIDFESTSPMDTKVTIYDLTGREITAFESEKQAASPLAINISNLKEGVYVMEITNTQFTQYRKFMVVK